MVESHAMMNQNSAQPGSIWPGHEAQSPKEGAAHPSPKISIITPSYNMLPYLKMAAASIADQGIYSPQTESQTGDQPTSKPEFPVGAGGAAITDGSYRKSPPVHRRQNNSLPMTTDLVEHLVIDGGSNDATREWLVQQTGIRSISEKDEGMYDAVNKGLKMARGDILAYLNCDEQYLPGTLPFVLEYFENHPTVDMIFGDLLLIRPDGSLIAFRKGYMPRWSYILSSHLYVLSCTMFFRRRIFEAGIMFDTQYRAAADAHFVVKVLRQGYKACHIKKYFSVFLITGQNMSGQVQGVRELIELRQSAPLMVRMARPFLNAARLTEKFFSGAYFQKKPLEYAVYTQEKPQQRKFFSVDKASFRWQFEKE